MTIAKKLHLIQTCFMFSMIIIISYNYVVTTLNRIFLIFALYFSKIPISISN